MLLTPLPLSQTVTLSRTPSPLERDVLYGRPLTRARMCSRKFVGVLFEIGRCFRDESNSMGPIVEFGVDC